MADITTGLVAHWKMDDCAGSTTVVDTINDYNGTSQHGNTNLHSVGGVIDGALSFDGSNDYITVADQDDLSFGTGAGGTDTPFSCSFWQYPKASANDVLIAKGIWDTTKGEWMFTNQGFCLRLFTTGNTNYIQRGAGTVYTLNTWNHCVFTYDGSKTATGIKIYLNGVRVDNTSAGAGTYTGMVPSTELVGIGATNAGVGKLNGYIDDVRLYRNRVLAQEDISALYNLGRQYFYLDYLNGLDATTATPLGWWSIAVTAGTGSGPVAGEACTSGAQHAHLTRYTYTSGAWGTNDWAGTLYLYGKTGAFGAGDLTWTGGSATIAGDATYCAWKTITSGALSTRIAPGDTIRIAKSWNTGAMSTTGSGSDTGTASPTSLGHADWIGTPTITTTAPTSSTNATPIVVTKVGHGLSTGDFVQITGHTTNTNANGMWKVTVSGDTFTLFDLFGGNSVGNGVGGATGTFQKCNNKVVTLETACTKLVDDCEPSGAWTPNGVGVTAPMVIANTDAKSNGGCLSVVKASAFGSDTLIAYKAITSYNFSTNHYQQLTFWVKNSVAIANATTWRICLCDDVAGASIQESFYIPAIPSTTYWVPITVNKGSDFYNGNIQSVAIYTGATSPAAQTLYIDNINACLGVTVANSLTLQSLISKNSAEQTDSTHTEGWYGLQSICDTYLVLDSGVNQISKQGKGYYSSTASEHCTTYKRETTKTVMMSSSAGSSQAPQDRGSSGLLIAYEGGYDTATNEQTGDTLFDGLNGLGYGLRINGSSFSSFNYLSFLRYYEGISCLAKVLYFDNISNLNNNSSNGISFANRYGTIVFNNVYNVNNNGSYNIWLRDVSNVKFTKIWNCNNSFGEGIRIDGSATKCIFQYLNINNCIRGIFNYGVDTLINQFITSYNSTSAIAIEEGGLTVRNWTSTSDSSTYAHGYGGSYMRDDSLYMINIVGASELYYISTDGGLSNSNTSERRTASGYCWKISPTYTGRSLDLPIRLKIAQVFCVAGSQYTVKAWMKVSSTTDIKGRLCLRSGQIAGDTYCTNGTYIDTTNADTNYEQLSITFTPSETGVVDIEAQAYWIVGTADESVYVDDVTITPNDTTKLSTLDLVYQGQPYNDNIAIYRYPTPASP